MIVVHPDDPSTKVLTLIYQGLENLTVFNSYNQREDILKAINSAPEDELIFLLGHGSPYGLFDKRFGYIIRDEDADILKGRPNLIGIWCYASDFAHTHGWIHIIRILN